MAEQDMPDSEGSSGLPFDKIMEAMVMTMPYFSAGSSCR
jgi:hypothetical protein